MKKSYIKSSPSATDPFFQARCAPENKHRQPAQCRLIKTDTTEPSIASLEVEQPGYRHFLSTVIRWPVTLGITLHPEHRGIESNPGQGQVKYESIVAFTRPQTNTVTSEHSLAK